MSVTLARLVIDAHRRVKVAHEHGAFESNADQPVYRGGGSAPCIGCGATGGASLHVGVFLIAGVWTIDEVDATHDMGYTGAVCDTACCDVVRGALADVLRGLRPVRPPKKRRRGHGKSTTASATRFCPTAAVRGGYAILKRNRRQRRRAATEPAALEPRRRRRR